MPFGEAGDRGGVDAVPVEVSAEQRPILRMDVLVGEAEPHGPAVVANNAVRDPELPARERGARGHARRVRTIVTVEDDRLPGELPEVRCDLAPVAIWLGMIWPQRVNVYVNYAHDMLLFPSMPAA